ncbi:flagellar biosynthesis anti-sigma factor FlgM [Kineothrix sp. MB12-C1]|uniref:flagellar biosynthesis anti-sigma factor FlgM n=1 Tax=Kineothrix sp. MB12-C1 TaxID=3070215 RepID=UPI0027D2A332|nr:flagellar biosynthesis anti-sigma factor FlgM [Kineothrix sp. MB12-C1]WMC93896.1 flagellar biosynthesis anti-sigma factor FlgM [Kineothrix sp. MB12-C1]
MRIEAYSQVQQIYKKTKIDKSQKAVSQSASDQLQISSMGREYQLAKQAIANSADVREEITAPLKKSIQTGTYEVSTEKFADKLLQKYEEMR